MKKLSVLTSILLAFASSTVPAATTLTAGNVVVLRCAGIVSTGNAGALVEYTPAGSVAQTITLPSSGSPAILFGSATTLTHDISLSSDGALVVIPGYATTTATAIDSSGANTNNRVIATLKWDGTVAYPIINSALISGQSPRGATSDGFGNFWATFTSGMRYVTPSAPTVSTTVNGTGSRACGMYNGQLYASVTAGVDYLSPNVPTGAATYLVAISGATSGDGFALPAGPTTGSKAYIANYNDTTGLSAFNWNGSGWDAPYVIKFTGITGNIQHIAVDYSGANPVIYFTTTLPTANNSLYKYTDATATGGTFAATTVATATSSAIFRGIAMAPTQPSLPSFTTSPANTTNNYGDTATFGPVAATGANPNGFTWLRDATPLVNGPTGSGSVISGATSNILTISGISSADAATNYFAVASNNGGSTTSAPAILALAGSTITTQLKSITNVAGTAAIFTVVSGGPAPLTYAWQLVNNSGTFPLSDGPSPSGSGAVISGSSTSSLTNTGVQDADAGTYTVTVTDGTPADSVSSAGLTVVDPPNITAEPGNQNKVQGATANFTVTATGNALSYQWVKGVTALTNGPSGTGAAISGATSSHLVVASVQPGDAGSFTVVVTNLAGSTTSTPPATLTVGVLPALTALTDATNVVGSNSGFSTTVTAGTAPFTYTWKHNGSVIGNDGHFFNADTASLGINNIDIPDQRLFSLSVSNSYGGTTVSANQYVIISTNQPNDVPNLIIYEPFNYPTGPQTAVGFYSWENIISIYNRVTGQPAVWQNAAGGLNSGIVAIDPTTLYTASARNGGLYPWPGIDCAAVNKWTFAGGGNNNHLKFGGISSGSAYFSFIFTGDQGSVVISGTYDVISGFTSGASDANGLNADTWNYKLCIKADDSPGETNPPNVDGPGGYRLGVFKGGNALINAGSVNGQFAPLHLVRGHPYFVVGCYKINSGGTTTNDDVVSLWVTPAASTFGASEPNVPTPDAGGMITNWNNNAAITEFGIRCANALNGPFSKSISDVRIGKTWASVTGPYYPKVTLSNVDPNIMYAWPAKDSFGGYGYQPQTSADLFNWTADTTSQVLDGSGKTNTVTETPVSPQFWRLSYPPRSGTFSQY